MSDDFDAQSWEDGTNYEPNDGDEDWRDNSDDEEDD